MTCKKLPYGHVTYPIDDAALHGGSGELLRRPFLEIVAGCGRSIVRETQAVADLRGGETWSRTALGAALLRGYSGQALSVEASNPLLDVGWVRPKRLAYLNSRLLGG